MRGLHVFLSIVAGAFAYLVLVALISMVVGGVAGGFLTLVGLAAATAVGVGVYRALRRRETQVEDE